MALSPSNAQLDLGGRRALVCGASAGIGRSIAQVLAAHGARVTAVARREDKLTELVAELNGAGAENATFICADLDDRDGAVAAVQKDMEQAGPYAILINNAGGPPGGPILEAKESEFETAIGRHLLASHRLVQTLLPGMREAGYGRIVNIISTSVREPIPNLGVSNTTRGAVAAWAKTVSKELPPGVTINNVLPGFTDTERLGSLRGAVAERTGKSTDQVLEQWLSVVPEGRLAEASEVAAMVAFLVSPAASFVRGQSIAVDGGRMASI